MQPGYQSGGSECGKRHEHLHARQRPRRKHIANPEQDRDTEFAECLAQIARITRFRLEAMVAG
jgi:2-oxo-4-hydroxy-4-carboxy--5-ureidoimidazoline (OHCU) decarboxylase